MEIPMDQTARQNANEHLAQMGIKRGSYIWPLLAIPIAIIVLMIAFQDPDKSPINELFKWTCQGVNGQTLVSGLTQPIAKECFGTNSYEQTNKTVAKFTAPEVDVFQKWLIIQDLFFVKTNTIHIEDPITKSKPSEKLLKVKHFWPLFVDTAQSYVSGLTTKFGSVFGDFFNTAWIVGLASLIPGLAGMIYRRNFWGWFTPTFIVLFVACSNVFGQQSREGAWFIFLASQLLIVLLALRLQRYTRKTGPLPSSVHNWLLAIALIVIPYVIWKYDIGSTFWSSWHTWYKLELIFVGLPVLYTLLRRSDAWNATAPKNIVVCLDGTTNTPDQFESGRLAQTNVFKLFRMLKADKANPLNTLSHAFNASLSKSYSDKQIAFYYSGVGNKFEYDPIVQMLGGATGLGAAAVVDRAYLDIIRVYRPGDRIFITGFSRGAAIARMLARAIDQRGAPNTIWTWRVLGRHWTLWQSRQSKTANVPVAMLGCFDTVGAFGIGKNIAGINFQKLDLFKDLTVPDNVEQAYHMVALDETREEFSPTLMDPDPMQPARIVEVWFSGDHANIGGGWGTTKLSDLTFDFLLRRISSGYAHDPGMTPGDESWGVYLNAVNGAIYDLTRPEAKGSFVIHPDPLGQLRLWRSAVYIYKPRELPHHAVISETVFERMTKAVPLYAPASLFNLHEELNAKRNNISTAIARLKETQSLSPEEHDEILTFKDRLHLIRWPQHKAALGNDRAPETVLSNEVASGAAAAAATSPSP
jgi:T6SS, Phospholipase effector Tle1-like, catalytic domain